MKRTVLFIVIALSMCFAEAQTSRAAQKKTPEINHAYILVNRSGYYYIKAYDSDYYVSPQYSNPSKETNVILWDKSDVAKWQFVRK